MFNKRRSHTGNPFNFDIIIKDLQRMAKGLINEVVISRGGYANILVDLKHRETAFFDLL